MDVQLLELTNSSRAESRVMMILVVLRWLVFGDDHVVVIIMVDKSQYQNLL